MRSFIPIIRRVRSKIIRSPTDVYLDYLSDIIAKAAKDLNKPIRVFDYGCGMDSPVRQLRCRSKLKKYAIEWIGGDIYRAAIEVSKEKGIHDQYVLIDYPTLKHVPHCDVVLLLDVIEHVDKDDAKRLISLLERKAPVVVIYTPNGFLKQDATPDNPFQKHQSGWLPKELEDLGYRVWGCGGWLCLQHCYFDSGFNQQVWTLDLKHPTFCFQLLRHITSWIPSTFLKKYADVATFVLAAKSCK